MEKHHARHQNNTYGKYILPTNSPNKGSVQFGWINFYFPQFSQWNMPAVNAIWHDLAIFCLLKMKYSQTRSMCGHLTTWPKVPTSLKWPLVHYINFSFFHWNHFMWPLVWKCTLTGFREWVTDIERVRNGSPSRFKWIPQMAVCLMKLLNRWV